jgi:membrane-bound metal-dependent hydrolase YbcI (DUF457 family)
MLLFGHAGITLGAATVLAGTVGMKGGRGLNRTSWFTALTRYVDIRVLVVGSLLPDIIDKPLGHFFLRDTLNNGRIYAHTLLFLLLIVAAGLFVYKRYHRMWLLTLAAGTLTHLILDGMWNAPATLLWPLMGSTFGKVEMESWVSSIFQALISDPLTLAFEVIGLAIVLWFGVTLIYSKKVGVFIRSGKVI